jgi:hypothetical protein
MAAPLQNFQGSVKYSDIENAYYDEIFSNKKNVPPDNMDSRVDRELRRSLEMC